MTSEKVRGIVPYLHISTWRHKPHSHLKQAFEFCGKQQGLKYVINLFQPKHGSKIVLKYRKIKYRVTLSTVQVTVIAIFQIKIIFASPKARGAQPLHEVVSESTL